MKKSQDIIQLLNEGKSYSDIQMLLNVSPSKISQVKKEFSHLLNSSSDSSSSSSSSSSGGGPNSIEGKDNYGISTESSKNAFGHIDKNKIDPETILRLKELEQKHEKTLKQMEYEEKEKERKNERRKKDKELEELRIKNSKNGEVLKLQEHVKSLEDKIEDLELLKMEQNDDKSEFDESKFYNPYVELLEMLVNGNQELWDEEEIQEALEDVKSLKQLFRKYCKSDGVKVKDFDEWEILKWADSELQDLLEKINIEFFSSRARLSIAKDWLDLIENHIKEN